MNDGSSTLPTTSFPLKWLHLTLHPSFPLKRFNFPSTTLFWTKQQFFHPAHLLLQFIVTLLCLFLLCKPFYQLTYYIWTVRRFDALHSHPLIISPSLYMFHSSYMFHILSCHYDTDISLICLMIADNPYCGHSTDSNYCFITMYYLIALGWYFRYIRTLLVPY